MIRSKAGHAVVLSALALSGLSWAQEAPVAVGELQEKWVGKALTVKFPNGFSAKLQFRPDSSLEISGAYNDVGKWRWKEPSGYCATWNTIRAREERCFTVTRKANDYLVANPDGSLNGTVIDIK